MFASSVLPTRLSWKMKPLGRRGAAPRRLASYAASAKFRTRCRFESPQRDACCTCLYLPKSWGAFQ